MGELNMSRSEAEAFLAETRVGLLAIARGDGSAPLVTPIWYEYEPGGTVRFDLAGDGEKARLLAEHGVASLCAQTEDRPYRWVTVGGLVTTGPIDVALRRRLAEKYLPAEYVEPYLATETSGDSLTAELTPRSWYSNDYSKLWR